VYGPAHCPATLRDHVPSSYTVYGRSPRRKRRGTGRGRTVLLVLGALLAVFVLIQFVPYGHDHANPPVTAGFRWTSPQAKAIAQRTCYDCHSNTTKWWWAVDVAPFSWLAQHDISSGRARLNFSEWNGSLSTKALQHALDDGMPPVQFTLLHPSAKLSAAERQQLLAGFQQSLAAQRQSAPGQTGSASTAGSSSGSSSNSASGSSSGGSSNSASGSSSSASAIISARCSTCHSSAPAQQFRASSASQARALIDQMIQQGAVVSSAEKQALVAYYTR
jgi:hypothetical protein